MNVNCEKIITFKNYILHLLDQRYIVDMWQHVRVYTCDMCVCCVKKII